MYNLATAESESASATNIHRRVNGWESLFMTATVPHFRTYLFRQLVVHELSFGKQPCGDELLKGYNNTCSTLMN